MEPEAEEQGVNDDLYGQDGEMAADGDYDNAVVDGADNDNDRGIINDAMGGDYVANMDERNESTSESFVGTSTAATNDPEPVSADSGAGGDPNQPTEDNSKYVIDPFKPYDPLEGTKCMIGHSEYEDAMWSNEIKAAEKYLDVVEKMKTGEYGEFDTFGPDNDMSEIRSELNRDNSFLNASRHIGRWSVDPYLEEYNPNAPEGERIWNPNGNLDSMQEGDNGSAASVDEAFSKPESNHDGSLDWLHEDESNLSPSELYERAQADMQRAQQEAETWADEQGMTRWSDGTARANSNVDAHEPAVDIEPEATQHEAPKTPSFDSVEELNDEVKDNLENDTIAKEEFEQLKADVEKREKELMEQLIQKAEAKSIVFQSAVDANNLSDAYRFADLQRDIGSDMEKIRAEIIANRNRLK